MSVPTTMKAVVIEGDKPVVKASIPVPQLDDHSLLVKVRAAAGNPTDWKHIAFKIGPQGSILGCDIAGEVVALGSKVDPKKFAVGDTVFGIVHGASVKFPENGGFAEYSRLLDPLTYKAELTPSAKEYIPEGTVKNFESAASLPVALTTAGVVLSHHLGSKLEWEPSKPQHDFPLLIWGGATSVGQFLIQLAKKMYCYTKIVAVASKKHESVLKRYGADEIFDYHDEDVIEQIRAKYPNLQHCIDAVSDAQTIQQVYRCTPDKLPTTLLNLTALTEGNIEKEERKSNVKMEYALLYLATGYEVPFGPHTLPANPEYKEAAGRFVEFVNPRINNGELHHSLIRVFENGLEDVPGLTAAIQAGKNSGVKFVAALK